MPKLMTVWLWVVLSGAACAAGAADLAVVSQLRMPVWLERDGQRAPLWPGQVLLPGDALQTGNGARVQLQMAEGSTVRLGADAHFRVAALEQRGDEVNAALEVVRGAFRFTTSAVSRLLRKRDVRIRVATLTAGIRGTDVWGRSNDAADVVCLLEGHIDVGHDDGTTADMAQPLTFFRALKGAAPDPVQPVAAEQIRAWTAETGLPERTGAVSAAGKWRLVLATFRREAGALSVQEQAGEAGYAARLRARPGASGSMFHEVVIDGFVSAADARAAAGAVRRDLALGPVVERLSSP